MACNRETSTDGSTSSAPPACQNAEALVPCCNNNCHFFGCAATMNLCSRCYSEHVLKEGGGVFLDKSCDATVDAPIGSDPSVERIEDAPPPAMPADDHQSGLREPSSKDNSMNRTVGVSDLHAIFRSVQSSSVGDMSSDLPQQRIPSPLSLPSRSPQAFSPVRRQVDNKLSAMPPLPPRQQAISRCLTCRKRVGLLGFKCRCGDIFCSLHRYSEKHDCSFDYKAAGRAVIAKENPVVKASKIERI